ncbi:MAG: hypothetical protein D6756_13055 [Cyanobacteria bacterium J083]|nr:MAG: hypothetical protein D6756_13055 [Cyanobacteria bacterium J083]
MNKQWESLLLAVTMVLITGIDAAQAQTETPRVDNLQQSTLNGLFTPNDSQRFFAAGKKDLEEEMKFLTNLERYLNKDILVIDEELIKQMQEIQPNQINFPLDDKK